MPNDSAPTMTGGTQQKLEVSHKMITSSIVTPIPISTTTDSFGKHPSHGPKNYRYARRLQFHSVSEHTPIDCPDVTELPTIYLKM